MYPYLSQFGRAGSFGACLDESARAAEDFCLCIDAVPLQKYLEVIECDHPDLTSIRGISLHCVN